MTDSKVTGFDQKYDDLIDGETWDFIKRTNDFYPPNAIDLTVAEQRETYDRLCREFFVGYPDGVSALDSEVASPDNQIPIRTYSQKNAMPKAHVLYLHGGGFVLGSLDSHDDVCAEICARTSYGVTSVDYRLAPEHIFPDDFNDCMNVFLSVANSKCLPIIVVGDSAGGTLAGSISAAARKLEFQPAGQVLIYPSLGADFTLPSYIEHSDAPMLNVKDMKAYKNFRTGGNEELLENPKCVPMADKDFSNLPPTFIVSAECDPLASDGEIYRDKIVSSGGNAVWINEEGLVHGYLRARNSVDRARNSFNRIIKAISNFGKGEWPYP